VFQPAGLTEEVIFMDSPGWQWGCPPKDVEDQLVTMKAVAENMGVAPDRCLERTAGGGSAA